MCVHDCHGAGYSSSFKLLSFVFNQSCISSKTLGGTGNDRRSCSPVGQYLFPRLNINLRQNVDGAVC